MDKAWWLQCSLFFLADDDIDFGELKWGECSSSWTPLNAQKQASLFLSQSALKIQQVENQGSVAFPAQPFLVSLFRQTMFHSKKSKSLSCKPKLMRNSVIYVGSCYLLVRKGYRTSGRTGTLLWGDSCTVWKRIIRILCWVIYTGNIVST
jgi:hypothetical protein